MQKTKVYWAPGNYLNGPQLRLNPGEAKDHDGGVEYELAYDGDLNKYLKNHFSSIAYRVFSNDHNLPWALSEEDANRIADEAGVPSNDEQPRHIMTAELRRPYLKPIVLPTTAALYKNDRGLFCRLNLHPEIDGSVNVLGKLFFPDRSCATDLCEGPCVITEIKDKGNYGFFKGHMQQFTAPSDDALDAYIREHNLYGKTLRYIKGRFGNYISIITKPHTWSRGYINDGRILFQNDNGEIEEASEPLCSADDTATITKEVSVADYLCEGYHGCKFDELLNKFVKPVFEPHANVTVSNKYISDLFDDAVNDGMLTAMTFQNIFYVNVAYTGLIRALMNYSREEMTELIETVNKINRTANEAIKGKIKRGQISIT